MSTLSNVKAFIFDTLSTRDVVTNCCSCLDNDGSYNLIFTSKHAALLLYMCVTLAVFPLEDSIA